MLFAALLNTVTVEKETFAHIAASANWGHSADLKDDAAVSDAELK